MARILFITGTDTAVGKTVLTTLLARHLRGRQIPVAALKPIASGNRDDARSLQGALGGTLSLDEINPWSFRAPLSPLVAARRERRRVTKLEVVIYVRRVARTFDVVLLEGAGGLLSPLGVDFDSRDLIAALKAAPLIVVPNRLGAVNQARLTLAALPRAIARDAHVVLMSPRRPDAASRTNPALISEFMSRSRLHELPWLEPAQIKGCKPLGAAAQRILNELAMDK